MTTAERFRLAMQGLALAATGGSRSDAEQRGRPDGARRFFGRTTESHWPLMRGERTITVALPD